MVSPFSRGSRRSFQADSSPQFPENGYTKNPNSSHLRESSSASNKGGENGELHGDQLGVVESCGTTERRSMGVDVRPPRYPQASTLFSTCRSSRGRQSREMCAVPRATSATGIIVLPLLYFVKMRSFFPPSSRSHPPSHFHHIFINTVWSTPS